MLHSDSARQQVFGLFFIFLAKFYVPAFAADLLKKPSLIYIKYCSNDEALSNINLNISFRKFVDDFLTNIILFSHN